MRMHPIGTGSNEGGGDPLAADGRVNPEGHKHRHGGGLLADDYTRHTQRLLVDLGDEAPSCRWKIPSPVLLGVLREGATQRRGEGVRRFGQSSQPDPSPGSPVRFVERLVADTVVQVGARSVGLVARHEDTLRLRRGFVGWGGAVWRAHSTVYGSRVRLLIAYGRSRGSLSFPSRSRTRSEARSMSCALGP